jgi:hypothetical protein
LTSATMSPSAIFDQISPCRLIDARHVWRTKKNAPEFSGAPVSPFFANAT